MANGELPPLEKERNWRHWILGITVLVLVIFIAQNAQKVSIDFLFVHTNAPLIVALVIAGILGAIIGYIGPILRRHRITTERR
jgi:uncharacterized integral membrane protein